MYQSLYRKWRPLRFSDVVGQEHVTETLRRQSEAGRLSHAYLFTGTRGTGKTTCAKILARAVNCTDKRNGDPCNTCPTCRGILDGSLLDVLEIDAASNSGVDNIRALRDESVYTPVLAQKRVYIIDEVHMLSIGAFNALLKTLEEPPAHLMFILATTETHKVPATILSRCQRFAFRRIPVELIAQRLCEVAGTEGLELAPEAARLLARAADGALRDALSLLDQCAAHGAGAAIDEIAARDVLGYAGAGPMLAWAESIANGDLAGALGHLDAFYRAGREVSSMLDELSLLLRDALLAALTGPGGEMREMAHLFTRQQLIGHLLLIQETQARLARSVNKRLEAELCLIRLCSSEREAASAPASEPARAAFPTARAPEPQTALPARQTSGSPEAWAPATEQAPAAEKAPVAEKALAAEQAPVAEQAPPAEPAGRRPDAARMAAFLGAVNPFFKLIAEAAAATEQGDELILTVEDDSAAHMLRQPEFLDQAKTFFPGGARVVVRRAEQADTKKRLSELKHRAGDLLK